MATNADRLENRPASRADDGRSRTAKVRTIKSAELPALVGREVALSAWIAVTQQAIDDFARVIGDPQWIHVDVERATRESPFRDGNGRGCTIAHGFLTLSLLSQLLETSLVISDRRAGINVGFNRIRFTAPVHAGSRVRGRFVLADLGPDGNDLKLTWDVTVEREGEEKPALVAQWLTRIVR